VVGKKKIAVIGAQGVGKTTLAKELSVKLRLPLIEERKVCYDLGIDNIERVIDPETVSMIQFEVVRRQINEEHYHRETGFVSDRSTLDNYVYYHTATLPDCEEIKQHYYNLTMNHFVKGYDVIIYVAPGIPLQDDGFRHTNERMQKIIDEHIRFYLSAVNTRAKVVRLHEKDGRLDLAIRAIGEG